MGNKRRPVFIVPLLGMALLLVCSVPCRDGVKNGLQLCAQVVIPALYPFSILASLSVRTGFLGFAQKRFGKAAGKLFVLPGCAAAPLAIGLLGGYPLGIHCLCGLYQAGKLTKEEAVRLSGFCNNPGPAFLIGAVGAAYLDSPVLGVYLLCVTFLAALLTGILLAPKSGGFAPIIAASDDFESFLAAFPAALQEGTKTMLRVTGTVVFFSAFREVLILAIRAARLPDWAGCLASGSLELTTGIASTQVLPLPLRFLICAVLVNWGGCCVHLQAADLLTAAGLPLRHYLTGKVVQTTISLLLAGGFFLFLFPSTPRDRLIGTLIAAAPLLFLLFFGFFQKGHWKTGKSVLY